MPARFAVYALIIAGVVGAVLAITWNRPARELASRTVSPTSTNRPSWEPSTEHAAEANSGFSVENLRIGNSRVAGLPEESNWPQFNGAGRDNRSRETGLLTSWPPEGPPLAWIARGLGSGFSTVAVVDGVVYTMGNKGDSEAIMALDAGTGEKIWCTPFAWSSHPSAGDGPRSTPAVAGESVFALGAAGDLVCLQSDDGHIRWHKNVVHEFDGVVPNWGFCESVMIDQGRLIVTPGGDSATMAALEPETGEVLWKSAVTERSRAGYASAAVGEFAGARQYIQFVADGTIGVRADDGQFLWRENTASNSSANCCSPLVSGEFVFSASGYGTGGALVRLTEGGSRAELVYHTRDMCCHHGDMVNVDGLLFGSHDPGVLTCLDLMTGDVKWKNRSVGKGAMTHADGKIYLRSEQGSVALIEAIADGYQELGRFEQTHRSSSSAWAHPVVAAKRLFLRDQDVLLCYDLAVQP